MHMYVCMSQYVFSVYVPGRVWTAEIKFKLLFPGGAAASPDPPFKSAWRPPWLIAQDRAHTKYIKCLMAQDHAHTKYIKCLVAQNHSQTKV